MQILLILFAPVIIWFSTTSCPELPEDLVEKQAQAKTPVEHVAVQIESMCAVRKLNNILNYGD